MKKIFNKKNAMMLMSIVSSISIVPISYLLVNETLNNYDKVNHIKKKKIKDISSDDIKLIFKVYYPSIISGAFSMACGISSTIFNYKTQKRLCKILSSSICAKELYEHKVEKLIGKEENDKIKNECKPIAMDNNTDSKLIFDMRTGEYYQGKIDYVMTDDGLECYIIDF